MYMNKNFVEDIGLVDKEVSLPLIAIVSSSLITCSVLCLRTIGCLGFSFHEITGSCRLHESFVAVKSVIGNRFWRGNCFDLKQRPDVYCTPSCYCVMPINMKKVWSEGRSYCDDEGYYMAKVNTQERLELALTVMDLNGIHYVWIGGYKETMSDAWQWLDTSPVDSSLIDIDGSGICIGVWITARRLDDHACSWQNAFLCQVPALVLP